MHDRDGPLLRVIRTVAVCSQFCKQRLFVPDQDDFMFDQPGSFDRPLYDCLRSIVPAHSIYDDSHIVHMPPLCEL